MSASDISMLLIGTGILWLAGFVVAPVIAALGRYQLAVTLVAVQVAVPASLAALGVAVAQTTTQSAPGAAASGFAIGVTVSLILVFAALALASGRSLEHHLSSAKRRPPS